MITQIEPNFSEDVVNTYKTHNDLIKTSTEKYKEITEYYMHQVYSKRMILNGAEGLKGRAIVLGLGNGIDIPLKQLAEQFDKIIGIDIDLKTMERTKMSLPGELRNKVELKTLDLTGIVAEFSQKVEAFAQKFPKPKFNEFYQKIAELIINLRPKRPDLPPSDATYITSSLILSQLASQIILYLRDIINKYYPDKCYKINSDLNILSILKTFADEVQTQHIENIHYWLKKKGRAYISTTYMDEPIVKLGDKFFKDKENPSCIMITQNVHIRERKLFKIIKTEFWDWMDRPPLFNMQKGSNFKVLSNIFEKNISD